MLKFFKYTNKKEFIKLVITRLITIGFGLLIPINIARAIDFAIGRDFDRLYREIIIMVVLNVGIHIFYVLEDYLFGKNDTLSYLNQFEDLGRAIDSYDTKKYQIDDARINQELGQNFELVQPFVYKNTLRIFLNLLKFVSILIIVFFISPYLLLAFLIIAPIAAIVSYKSEEKISDYSSDHLEDMKNMKGYLFDAKKLSKEERFLDNRQLPPIGNFFKNFKDNLLRKVRYESVIYNIFVYGTLNMAITLTTIISVILIVRGEMSPGDYAAVSIYISSMWDPILDLFNTRREYVSGKPALNSYEEFISMDPVDLVDEKIESIFLKDYVSLGSSGERLHAPLTAGLKKDRINLIVGDNGIGKTTLIEAIMNLTDRYEGKIFINEKGLDKSSSTIFKDLAYIPADPVISKYGRLKDKLLGSSGQRKLAQLDFGSRKDASVYIFDEPTNFLDSRVKGKVIDLIGELLSKNRIVIVISHDPIFLEDERINLIRIQR